MSGFGRRRPGELWDGFRLPTPQEKFGTPSGRQGSRYHRVAQVRDPDGFRRDYTYAYWTCGNGTKNPVLSELPPTSIKDAARTPCPSCFPENYA